jgi:hypothetical protein
MDTTRKSRPPLAESAAAFRDDGAARAGREEALVELIAAYAGSKDSPTRVQEAGNLLAEALDPLIRQVAQGVARGGSRWEREDFVEEAASLVLAPREGSAARICSWRPGESLRGWLVTVLRNLWVSDRRRRRCRQQAVEECARRQRAPAAASDSLCPIKSLSGGDLDRIVQWDCRRRVEVLAMAGLWPNVPSRRWESWLVEYEGLRRRVLGRPFPGDDVLCCDEPAERLRPLAGVLGYTPNTLAVRWLRSKECLKELDFVRELQPM